MDLGIIEEGKTWTKKPKNVVVVISEMSGALKNYKKDNSTMSMNTENILDDSE